MSEMFFPPIHTCLSPGYRAFAPVIQSRPITYTQNVTPEIKCNPACSDAYRHVGVKRTRYSLMRHTLHCTAGRTEICSIKVASRVINALQIQKRSTLWYEDKRKGSGNKCILSLSTLRTSHLLYCLFYSKVAYFKSLQCNTEFE